MSVTHNLTCDICGAVKMNSESASWGSLRELNFPVRTEHCCCPDAPIRHSEYKWRGPLFDIKDYKMICEECQEALFTAVRVAYKEALAGRLKLKEVR